MNTAWVQCVCLGSYAYKRAKREKEPNGPMLHECRSPAVFLFFYFSISFITKIYFRFRNLQIYTPAALLRGGRGFYAKSFIKNLHAGPWRTGRPAAGRPAPQAARQLGGRPWAFRARDSAFSGAATTTPDRLAIGGVDDAFASRGEIWNLMQMRLPPLNSVVTCQSTGTGCRAARASMLVLGC